MGRSILILLILGISLPGLAQTSQAINPVKTDDILKFNELSYDFGKIPQGKPVTHIFEMTNLGAEQLVLENVQASCGCTTPEWSRDPIEAGKSGQIKVGYNAAAAGHFEKNITITYNKGKTRILVIKGEVWKTPDKPAPENGSVSLLKNTNN